MIIGLLTVLLLAGAPGDSTAAKARFTAANHDYAKGDFAAALVGFTAAYDLYPAPEFIFNIGQCHFNLGDYDNAVFFYERYLRERANAPDARAAHAQLNEARKRAADAAEARRLEATRALSDQTQRAAAAQRAHIIEVRRLEALRSKADAERDAAAAVAAIAIDDGAARNQLVLWSVIGGGGVVVAGVVVAVAAVLLQPDPRAVPPATSLGRIDLRNEP